MTTLENLWYGNIQPYDMDLVPGSPYDKAFNRKIRYEEELMSVLSDEQKEIYEKLSNTQSEQLSLGECDAFRRGFSIGHKISASVRQVVHSV